MLETSPVAVSIPSTNLERAKSFYFEKLGLKALPMQTPGMAMFEAGRGTRVILYEREPAKADHTVATFLVDDVARTVRELKGRGVVFEEYDLPHIKTENSIAQWRDEKAAWFKDTEGNIISLMQARRRQQVPMNSARIIGLIIALLIVLALLGVVVVWGLGSLDEGNSGRDNGNYSSDEEIGSFKECAEAGYPIMESFPRRCRTEDGRVFTEGEDTVGEGGEISGSQLIETLYGSLVLSYESSESSARIEGTLNRPTPCHDWVVQTSGNASEEIVFAISLREPSPGEVCAQVISPEVISTMVQGASPSTIYTVLMQGEIVFQGQLTE